MRRPAALLIAALTLTGCTAAGTGGAASPPASSANLTDVTGSLLVGALDYTFGGADCLPAAGYEDIHPDAQVVLSDDSGKTLAVGALGDPTLVKGRGVAARRCRFAFELREVDLGDGQYYSIAVGHRGQLRYTRDQLAQPLELTLE